MSKFKSGIFRRLGILVSVCTFFIIVFFTYSSYEMNSMENDKKVSTDITALKNIINFEIPSTQLQWEVFGTPEYTGGIPAPTDYMTLISEIKVANDDWFNMLNSTNKEFYLVPESSRPWLSTPFKMLMQQGLQNGLDLAKTSNCKSYETKRKNGKTVHGFICLQNDSLLLYLTLVQPFQ